MNNSQRLGAAPMQIGLRVVGAVLLAATGAIHLDLYVSSGFKNIPTIGPLFLLQVIAAFVLALAVLIPRGRLIPAMGALFAAATLGGYLLSIWFGLFGYHEVRTTTGIVAGVIEVAAFGVLATVALTPAAPGQAGGPLGGLLAAIPGGGRLAGGLSALALILLIIAVAGAGSSAANAGSSGQMLKSTSIKGVTVLTNAKGITLYWFAPDSSTKSVCNGSCAQYWPPLPGPVHLASGVTGSVGTITRSDGSSQATYNGHPLYTYVSDRSPGQATGNKVNVNGGFWYEMKVSN